MRVGSVYSGIGGLDLGLERAGMSVAWQCEIDPYCRAVLAKHGPGVPCYESDEAVPDDATPIDLLCGGPPCQPASCAGKRKGLLDDRWRWPAFLSLVQRFRPLWVLAENPLGLASLKPHGAAWVFDQLEAMGYETTVPILGAGDVGAPHKRRRIWIVGRLADTTDQHGCGGSAHAVGPALGRTPVERSSGGELADAPRHAGQQRADGLRVGAGCDEAMADAEHGGRQRRESQRERSGSTCIQRQAWPARPGEPQHEWEAARLVEFRVGQPVDGPAADVVQRLVRVSSRDDAWVRRWWSRNQVRIARRQNRDALRALGNAVVPAVAELIGRAIMQANGSC